METGKWENKWFELKPPSFWRGFCFFDIEYVEFDCRGYRIMAIIFAFQANDTGSTPVTRSPTYKAKEQLRLR